MPPSSELVLWLLLPPNLASHKRIQALWCSWSQLGPPRESQEVSIKLSHTPVSLPRIFLTGFCGRLWIQFWTETFLGYWSLPWWSQFVGYYLCWPVLWESQGWVLVTWVLGLPDPVRSQDRHLSQLVLQCSVLGSSSISVLGQVDVGFVWNWGSQPEVCYLCYSFDLPLAKAVFYLFIKCRSRDWFESFTDVKQVLYHWATSPRSYLGTWEFYP